MIEVERAMEDVHAPEQIADQAEAEVANVGGGAGASRSRFLSFDERKKATEMLMAGDSIRQISRVLGRAHSSIHKVKIDLMKGRSWREKRYVGPLDLRAPLPRRSSTQHQGNDVHSRAPSNDGTDRTLAPSPASRRPRPRPRPLGRTKKRKSKLDDPHFKKKVEDEMWKNNGHLTTGQMAAILNCSPSTAHSWSKKNNVKSGKVARRA
mmetsp:Transcript_10162/g.25374  ORF Transcript_10162/g.25374 Transcript_10162/m.25374 type:complete len:208 (+) Transcript_10162:285-908(+)